MSLHANIHLVGDPFMSKKFHYHDNHDPEVGVMNSSSNATTLPNLWGIPLKYLSLVILGVQNSVLTLIMHHSRVSVSPSHTYSAATAVLMTEILKGSISFVIAFIRLESTTASFEMTQASFLPGEKTFFRSLSFFMKRLCREVLSPDCWKLSIPAILYVIQNNLQYVAASNLEAATFQVTYQMKILTTAVFSVFLLRKKLSYSQWLSLFVLAIGVGVVQIQAGASRSNSLGLTDSTTLLYSMNAWKGFLAVVAACFTSGLAGVYFEMILKNSQTDLWIRNVQLSLFSLLPALVPVLLLRGRELYSAEGLFSPLFRNFGKWAWTTVSVQVLGGLVTAMAIKYSDNIMKGFATSLSIVISFLASVALFDFRISFTFVLGSSIVLLATWLYNQHPKHFNLNSLTDPHRWGCARNERVKNGDSLHSDTPDIPQCISLTSMSSTSSLSSLASAAATSPPLSEREGKRFPS